MSEININEHIDSADRLLAFREDNSKIFDLTIRLHLEGKTAEAYEALRPLLIVEPENTKLLDVAATFCMAMGRVDSAIEFRRKIVSLELDNPYALFNLASCLHAVPQLAEAEIVYRSALAIKSDFDAALSNLGAICFALGRLEEAEYCYRRSIELNAYQVNAHFNLGSLLLRQNRHDEAEREFRQAIQLKPNSVPIRYFLSTVLLAKGNYEEAWPLFEYRYQGDESEWAEFRQLPVNRPKLGIRQWRGESLRGERLLIVTEQGLGDVIQFVRYIRLLKKLGAERLTINCRPELERLIRSVPGVDEVISSSEQRIVFAQHDYWCFLMSAPFYIGTNISTIPSETPYIEVTNDDRENWRKIISSGSPCSKLKVGIVWAGNPRLDQAAANEIDSRRSIHALLYLPILKTKNVEFISLQKGTVAQSQIDDVPAEYRPLDIMDKVVDLYDTAAIIECLDLVITVDTSIAHLAGALGKPVWILSRHDSCWRWLRDRDDSPWYPSARLFRQQKPGDWYDVIERVKQALSKFVHDEFVHEVDANAQSRGSFDE
jgi:tetratricopeptide (TPR) repeat protein